MLAVLYMLYQEEEVSVEMFTFHEVMNQLQEMEEQVVDSHRTCLEVGALKENETLNLKCYCVI